MDQTSNNRPVERKTRTKFTEERQKIFLDSIARGARVYQAADAAGVHKTTIWLYAKDNPDFAEQWKMAELYACEIVEDALWKKAVDGHFGAMVFWLCNRSRGRWVPTNLAIVQQVQTVNPDLAEVIERAKQWTDAGCPNQTQQNFLPLER